MPTANQQEKGSRRDFQSIEEGANSMDDALPQSHALVPHWAHLWPTHSYDEPPKSQESMQGEQPKTSLNGVKL